MNVREINISTTGKTNTLLEEFIGPIRSFFISPDETGGPGLQSAFVGIAFQIKNFFIYAAVLFLIIPVLKLLFSPGGEEDVKKWKSSIIWVSTGIIVMQIAFSVWNTFLIKSPTGIIGAGLAWQIWLNVFLPLVSLMQMLASFGFLFMMVYAFFMIVTGGGDEEKLKKGKNIVIYALIGFILIRLPKMIVTTIYGEPDCKAVGPWDLITVGSCKLTNPDLPGALGVVAKVVNYLNTFLAIICVLMIIYAGWLVFISGGDEEKLKKAKNIILYIIVGFVILVASHTLFRFFILNG